MAYLQVQSSNLVLKNALSKEKNVRSCKCEAQSQIEVSQIEVSVDPKKAPKKISLGQGGKKGKIHNQLLFQDLFQRKLPTKKRKTSLMKQILAGNRSDDKGTFLIRHSITIDRCATILRCDLNL